MEFLIRLKCAKISFLHESLLINQLEFLSHVVVKEEVESLHKSYLKITNQSFYTPQKVSSMQLSCFDT